MNTPSPQDEQDGRIVLTQEEGISILGLLAKFEGLLRAGVIDNDWLGHERNRRLPPEWVV